jgi:hypothetical protein
MSEAPNTLVHGSNDDTPGMYTGKKVYTHRMYTKWNINDAWQKLAGAV